MKTFTDAAGRTWTIALTLGTAMHVKDSLGVDLLQPEAGYPTADDSPLLTQLGTDELLLGRVLCALLAGQFEAHKVTEADVWAGFDGKTLLAAQGAFYEELEAFFTGRGRTDRAKAVAAQVRLIDAGVKAAEARIDAIDVDEVIHGAMSGSPPAPSASTQGP